MRKLTALLFSTVLALAWAGSSSALTIDPNPLHHERDGGSTLEADVSLVSIVGDTMTLQLSVTTGTMTGVEVFALLDLAMVIQHDVIDAGTNPGPGVDLSASVASGKGVFSGTVGAGQSSDEFWVQFDAPIELDWTSAIAFDTGVALQENYTVVPEPGTLLLMGLGVGGLLLARRRLG